MRRFPGQSKPSGARTDAEIGRLHGFLSQLPGAMNVETMDGFFSALICAPDMLPMGEVMSWIWSEDAQFASGDEAREITSLLMRQWNVISSALNGDDLYWPILLEDEAGTAHATDWAQGFCLGMELGRGSWASF